MKLFKVVTCGVLSLVCYEVALGEAQVSSELKSADTSEKVNFYGSLQLRFEQNSKSNEYLSTVSPSIGAKWLEDRLDTSFAVRYGKSSESAVIQSLESFNETMFNVYKNKYMATGPYGFSNFDPTNGMYDSTDLGWNVGVSTEFNVGGTISLSSYVRPQIRLLSSRALKKTKVIPKNQDSELSLTETQVEPKKSTYVNSAQFASAYSPSLFKDATLKLIVQFDQEVRPEYVLTMPPSEAGAEFDGYRQVDLTTLRTVLDYRVLDDTTLSADFRQYTGGVFAREIKKSREGSELTTKKFETLISLSKAFE